MKTIYKYELAFVDRQTIDLPVNAWVLSAAMQNGSLCIWAVVDTTAVTVTTPFFVFGTGHPIPPQEIISFISTVFDGPFVWHIFKGF